MRRALLLLLVPFFQQARAQNFTNGNLIIYRVGRGSAALSNAATAVFLDEYAPSGSLVQSLALPTAASGTNLPLTASGTATSEGLLGRSADGNYLLVTGYGTVPGTASVAGTASTSVPRVVGLVNYQRVINTSTGLTDMANANNIRSAASTDGATIWVSGGAGGIRYTTAGSTTSTQINTTGTNFRALSVQGGQLYVSSASGTVRVATVGTGTPTGTGQAITNVNGYPITGTSPYQFQFFDLNASIAGPDVLYVSDDGLGLQKYSLVGGTWTLNGTIGSSSDQYRGLAAALSGGNVVLYATRKGNELVTLTDATGYNAAPTATPTLLATAATNTAFRGIAFAPAGAAVNNLSFGFAAGSPFLAPPAVGTVVSDPTDPLALKGINLSVQDNGADIAAANYTLTATSNNTVVVPNTNINVAKSDGMATVKITAAGTGYADITLTLSSGSFTRTITLNIAASAAANAPANSRFHSGASDASAAIALDDRYMVVGDDEMNRLFVYNRDSSGLPAASFDYSNLLSLTDLSGGQPREVDVEAGVRSIGFPNRMYWLGSMSNSATSFNARPNRNRLFAVTVTGTGSTTSFGYVGMYTGLRQDLLTWGDANGYSFTAAAAAGKDPKQIDGFNIEGLTMAPDNTTAYIAFRAPLVPTANRTKAVIAPVLNFETWFNNGSPAGSPTLGTPIELDLNGRGFRDIVRLSNGNYVILAGNYDDTPLNPAIYLWSGLAANAPTQLTSFNTTGLNPEAVMEARSGGVVQNDRLQVLSDNGDNVYYGDGTAAKDLGQNNFKKFESDLLISGAGSVLPLQLIHFTVTRSNDRSLIGWDVSGGSSGERFVIERSADGRSFASIGEMNAVVGQSRYEFSNAVRLESRLYYRLAQVDASGRTSYSAIRIVSATAVGLASIYPNPVVNGQATVTTSASGLKYALVLDAGGRQVRSSSFSGGTADLSLTGLPAGTYHLVLTTREQIIATEAFVIR